ncbi:MAG: hypothetical protein ACLP6G_13090 [Terriglobales bacterium]
MAVEDKSRLTPLDRGPELLPLKRAEQLTRCALYWIPVNAFPIPSAQRQWLDSFLDRLSEMMRKKHALRAELFLQYKTVYPALLERFLDNARDLIPLMGLGQCPGKELPPIPSIKDLQPLIDGKEEYDFGKYVGDFCYWFVRKHEKKQRELFWGYGGVTILFLTPDPNTKVEPLPIPKGTREYPVFADLFKRFDPDEANATAHALGDSFRKKSLELFSQEIQKNVQLKGIPFVVPLLGTRDFFNRPEEECKKWFELFDVYVNESPADKGIVIASKLDVEEDLIGIVRQMKTEGLRYSL